MSYDPNAEGSQRIIAFFGCAPLPGTAVVNQVARQGGVSARWASILTPRPLGLRAPLAY